MKLFLKKTITLGLLSLVLFQSSVFAYNDVDQSSPYYYSIEHLRRNGVIKGSGNFRPNQLITKAEFIKYLVLLNNSKFKPGESGKTLFIDIKEDSWYAPYFEEAVKLGILEDRAIEILPNKRINQIQAIELLFRSKSLPIPTRFVGEIPYKDVAQNSRYKAMIMRAANLDIIQPKSDDYFGIYSKITRAEAAEILFNMEMLNLRVPEPELKIEIPTVDPELQKIINSWELINSTYVYSDDISKSHLSKAAIDALVESLDDPYSNYLDAESAKNFNEGIDGEFEGIGTYVSIEENGEIVVVSPIEDSPADQAGLESGDVFLEVDGKSTEGLTLQEAIVLIKGPKGTKVNLKMRRGSQILNFEVLRDKIVIKSVEYKPINDNIMYIKLVNFNDRAVEEITAISEIILNNKKIKGVIIDVRGNPGGLLDSAIDIASLFLPRQSIVAQIKYNFANIPQKTRFEGALQGYPVAVLTDKGSASASEILAGALNELIDAIIVGETTFGKGTVQEVNYFADTSSLKITVAKWLTPSGKSIQGNGITPTYEVLQPSGEKGDRILDRAILELNKSFQ